jgi:hypothetical protein
MVYHLSQEARDELLEFRLPHDFNKKLCEFQVAAVKIASHHLNKRRGVLIGDVVGLGKTLMATSMVEFPAAECDHCPLRAQCTTAVLGHGRTVSIAQDEPFQHRLRQRAATRAGRAQLRQRVEVEHRLAHLGARQGRRARYKGVRKNLLDARRTAAVLNLETLQRKAEAQELPMAA